MKTPREVVQDWLAAYNQRDARAAAELYHEDAYFSIYSILLTPFDYSSGPY